MPEIFPEISAGEGLHADPSALIGYPPGRTAPRGLTARGLTLGRGARIRSGCVLYLESVIGDRFQAGHNVVIREDCLIGDDVAVWSNSVVDYGCRIGDRVKIHSNCYVAQFTQIEDDAFLAPGVMIANDLYPGQQESAELMSGPLIGAGAQLGVNVTVLPYVRIGAGCLIGAGAVVARDIPAGRVAYGNPARARGYVRDLEAIGGRVTAAAGSVSRYRLGGPGQAGQAQAEAEAEAGTVSP